jgi:hypothetical protein
MIRFYIVTVAVVFGFVCGCAGASFRVGDPWDPKERDFFDDGIDVFEDLSSLSGEWAYRQENMLEARTQISDFMAEVKVQSVQTSSDVDGGASKRIVVVIRNRLYGESPDKRITLESIKDSPGHELILRYEDRLLNGNYIVFLRWFDVEKNDQNGGTSQGIGHHFHLSPASEKIKESVSQRVRKRKREEAAAEAVK